MKDETKKGLFDVRNRNMKCQRCFEDEATETVLICSETPAGQHLTQHKFNICSACYYHFEDIIKEFIREEND